MELLILLVVWSLMSWGIAALASSRGRSGLGFFLLSFVFSPLLALVVVLIMKNLKEESERESARRREDEQREEERRREHEKQLESLRVLTTVQSAKAAPIDSPTSHSVADELTKLSALRDQGVLSAEEFDDLKKSMLRVGRQNP